MLHHRGSRRFRATFVDDFQDGLMSNKNWLSDLLPMLLLVSSPRTDMECNGWRRF